MRAYARASDPDQGDRAAARVARRQGQSAYQAQHNRLGFRRTPPTPKQALVRAQGGVLGGAHARRRLVDAERDAVVLVGQLPADLQAAADAYHRRWLRHEA